MELLLEHRALGIDPQKAVVKRVPPWSGTKAEVLAALVAAGAPQPLGCFYKPRHHLHGTALLTYGRKSDTDACIQALL